MKMFCALVATVLIAGGELQGATSQYVIDVTYRDGIPPLPVSGERTEVRGRAASHFRSDRGYTAPTLTLPSPLRRERRNNVIIHPSIEGASIGAPLQNKPPADPSQITI